MPYVVGGKASWWGYLRWRYSPYWRGYRAGISARERALKQAEELQRLFD